MPAEKAAAKAAHGPPAAPALAGRRVMVVGLGVSGRAAARLLHRLGAQLLLADARREAAKGLDVDGQVLIGDPAPGRLAGVELAVASPGVSPDAPLLRALDSAGVPVIGELELACRFISAPIVGVTGTNGKSTVTTLVGAMLKAAGHRVFVGGNLGTPLSEAAGAELDVAVVEVSSFQLERIETFRPRVAVLLNITEDHLDRHRSLEAYRRAKARLFMNQGAEDWAIVNRDDPLVWDLRSGLRARVLSFGARPAPAPAAWSEGQRVVLDDGRTRRQLSLAATRLVGIHASANAMAAAGAAMLLGVPAEIAQRCLESFVGLPHRMERFCRRDGVDFVDDSKATNVGAVVAALAALFGPVILLAGGRDKGGSYAPLCAAAKGKVRLAILFGEARETMQQALKGGAKTLLAQDLEEAVRSAWAAARPGDTVLLSPACSSFDQFIDYAERGRRFQELVASL